MYEKMIGQWGRIVAEPVPLTTALNVNGAVSVSMTAQTRLLVPRSRHLLSSFTSVADQFLSHVVVATEDVSICPSARPCSFRLFA